MLIFYSSPQYHPAFNDAEYGEYGEHGEYGEYGEHGEYGEYAYLIFVTFFTPTHFEAWKFYTQKCVNSRQKWPRDKTA